MSGKTVQELYDDALAASNAAGFAAGFAFMPVAQVIDQQDAEIMQLRAERDALKADIDRRIRADENIRKRWKEYAEELKADAERYRLRLETIRALYPNAPSDAELDIALDAAIRSDQR